jgi:hypothetical protein
VVSVHVPDLSIFGWALDQHTTTPQERELIISGDCGFPQLLVKLRDTCLDVKPSAGHILVVDVGHKVDIESTIAFGEVRIGPYNIGPFFGSLRMQQPLE